MTKCPSCGAAATGTFCSSCGAALAAATCPSCGTELTPGARFCHVCGARLGARARSPGAFPWIVAGGALAALAIVAVVALRRPPAGDAGGGAAEVGSGMAAPASDISQLSPRERADRLFDRIMRAAERGDSAEIRFFRPMAVQAYALLGPPDPHIRYDIGMIHAMSGDVSSALAEADSIERAEPGNLLALLIRGAVAGAAGDSAVLRRVYRAFLDRYDREIAANRAGYAEHRTGLDGFRDAARQAAGTARRPGA